MKIRLWHIGFFVVALIAFAVAWAPPWLFVPKREGGFTYERATGTIWSARFEGARLGALDAGDVGWKLSLFGLFQGKIDADLVFAGGAVRGDVNVLANWGGDRRVIAPSLRIEGAALGEGAPLSGVTTIEDLDLYFSEGRCVTAAGRLTSDVLTRNSERLRWRGPALGGEASCAEEAAQLALFGGADGDNVQSMLNLGATGSGEWRTYVSTAKPPLRAALEARGFTPAPGGQNMVHVEEFRWLPL